MGHSLASKDILRLDQQRRDMSSLIKYAVYIYIPGHAHCICQGLLSEAKRKYSIPRLILRLDQSRPNDELGPSIYFMYLRCANRLRSDVCMYYVHLLRYPTRTLGIKLLGGSPRFCPNERFRWANYLDVLSIQTKR